MSTIQCSFSFIPLAAGLAGSTLHREFKQQLASPRLSVSSFVRLLHHSDRLNNVGYSIPISNLAIATALNNSSVSIIYTASLTNGNWVDNVIIWYSSVMHQNQQYHSASLQWLHIWNHTGVRIQEFIISILRHPIFHLSHSVTSEKSQDHPPLDLSGY